MSNGKLILHIANADDSLTDLLPTIERVVAKAEKIVLPRLDIDWYIDILVWRSDFPINQTGVGGYTPTRQRCYIYIDPKNMGDDFADELLGTVAHEISHTKRYATMDYSDNGDNFTVLDYFIFEGLATAFENEIVGHDLCYVRDFKKRNLSEKSYVQLKPYFDIKVEDAPFNQNWFYGDTEHDLPVRAGYELGYFLVEKYAKKHSKRPSELFSIEPREFI